MKIMFYLLITFNSIISCNTNTTDDYFKSGIRKYEFDLDYKGAINDYNKVIKINPKHLKSYINRGASKYNLQDYKGAIEDFNKAIEITPLYKIAFFNKAASKSRLSDHRGAIADYTKSIKIDSNYAIAYIRRGKEKEKLKDFKGAIEDYSKALKIDWRHFDLPQLESEILTFVDFRRIILNSDTGMCKANIYIDRGKLKEKVEDYEGAVEDYSKAIEIATKNEDSFVDMYYSYRGLAKIKLGQKDSGCLDLSKAGELGVNWVYDSINKYCQ